MRKEELTPTDDGREAAVLMRQVAVYPRACMPDGVLMGKWCGQLC